MIIDIWKNLEEATTANGKYLIRRYSFNADADIYAALRRSTGEKGIAVSIGSAFDFDISRYADFKDIKIEKAQDEYKRGNTLILILLTNPQHLNVFATLCTDLIHELGNITQEARIVKGLFNRLEHWKSLFAEASSDGLSPEAQRGLYGELFFLRSWLRNCADQIRCLTAWVGPEKAIRDFQLEDWALEVKTSYGNNHQRLSIASERQLDTTKLSRLVLFHLAIEVQQENGETLNQLVSAIRDLIADDYMMLVQFNAKLLLAGYFDHHISMYESKGYQTRKESYYTVEGKFPRIEEKDILPGVGDVKYSIIISDFEEYMIPQDFVFEIIN